MKGCQLDWVLRVSVLVLSMAASLNGQGSLGIELPETVPPHASPRRSEESEKTIRELARQRRWSDVARLARDLADNASANPTGWFWLGVASLQGKDSIGAVQAFRTAEKCGLDSPELHEGLGLAYYDLNQFFLFEQEMQRASKQNPQDARPYFYLGRYRELIKSDFTGALALFNQALQARPEDMQSVYHKGYCLDQMGRREEAREFYLKAIQLAEKQGSQFGWPYQGLAHLYLDVNPQEALRWAQKAVEVDPNEFSNHVVLAKLLQKLGKKEDAMREARAAIALNPTCSTARYILFKIYRQTGDQKAALAELELFQRLKALYGPE